MEIKNNVARISKYFKLPTLELTKLSESLAKEDELHTNKYLVHQDNYIFGVEVEVENVADNQVNAKYASYWNVTTDGSLRNNGVEFVSVPLRMSQLEKAFNQLFVNTLREEADFSERTSIHVHMNVRDLQVHQIGSLVLLYTAVEDLLFNWVGHGRDSSVFCIKLTETQYADMFAEINGDLRAVVDNWNKYTALNLAPIGDKGTVEFRHMHGTKDWTRILTWINMLARLKTAAKASTTSEIFKQISQLNASSNYEEFIRNIFSEMSDELLRGVNVQVAMEDAVSYVKLLQVYAADQAAAHTAFFDEMPRQTAAEWLQPAIQFEPPDLEIRDPAPRREEVNRATVDIPERRLTLGQANAMPLPPPAQPHQNGNRALTMIELERIRVNRALEAAARATHERGATLGIGLQPGRVTTNTGRF